MTRRIRDFAGGVALGSVLAFFFHPAAGRRERTLARDRALGVSRRGGRRVKRAGRRIVAQVYGVSQHARHLREVPKDYDDVTLARKVQTEIFRPEDVPKGQINVNVQNGVVQLRGEVPRPDMIDELVSKTRRVQGVRAVENLLHLPGAHAQMHQ